MQRDLMSQLKEWQHKSIHLPILLRGARQVGKTYLVEMFGKECFESILSINFELSPEYIGCFQTLKPLEIISQIEIISQQDIVPGKTLLFLDEIQACPNAIMALRYFKEHCPKLHVIGAGSLLEFALQEKGMKMPVGRVQYLYLKPLSFSEFLKASGNHKLLSYLNNVTLNTDIPEAIHNKALELVRIYMAVGGMPMVVNSYINQGAWRECQQYQTLLLKTYSDDFAKYSTTTHHKYLQQVFDKAPGLVSQQIRYVNISPDMDSRFLKRAIQELRKAGVIFPIYATSAAGLPLLANINEKKFKLLILDIGLLKRAMNIELNTLLNDDLVLVNQGAMTEQFVGQELLAYQDVYSESQLYYWSRDKKSSTAELDYLVNFGEKIIPIEVKSGKTGSLKSLHLFLKEKSLPLGVRVSTKKLHLHENILSVPFYMIAQLERLTVDLL